MLSPHSGTVARHALDCLLDGVKDRGPFSTVFPGDLEIEACPLRLDGSRPELTFRFTAQTPRGAVFLGEIASVGFFGGEAQEILAL